MQRAGEGAGTDVGTERTGRWLALAAALGWVGIGAALAVGAAAMSAEHADAAPGPVRYWVADRDAREVVALDQGLFVVSRTPLDWPIELETRRGGGVWVACATGGGPLAPHSLKRLSASGALELELAIGPLFDLDCLDGDHALLVDGQAGGGRAAAIVAADGTRRPIGAGRGVLCLAGRGGRLLAGTDQGTLSLHDVDAPERVLAQRAFGGSIADVAPGPRRDTWWVLDASGGAGHARVALLDGQLASVWERPAGLNALHLVPVDALERVWIADSTAPLARRFGPNGAVEIAAAALTMSGAERGVGLADGGALFAAPGAVLRVDALGGSLPGQGGFDFLTDIAAR